MTTDERSHPWPEDGKMFEFRWRKAVWMPVRPWYEANGAQFSLEDIWFLAVIKGAFPFFTYRIKWRGKDVVHGYIGWKPIPVADDPAFDWSKLPTAQRLIREKSLFVQLSTRPLGFGSIS